MEQNSFFLSLQMLLRVPKTFISFLSVKNLLVSYDCQMVYRKESKPLASINFQTQYPYS